MMIKIDFHHNKYLYFFTILFLFWLFYFVNKIFRFLYYFFLLNKEINLIYYCNISFKIKDEKKRVKIKFN